MKFTREEVARHNTRKSCWLIANGSVYDVTQFLKLYPGHIERVMEVAGTDVTRDFMFHSITQRGVWRTYKIGTVDDASGCCTCM